MSVERVWGVADVTRWGKIKFYPKCEIYVI